MLGSGNNVDLASLPTARKMVLLSTFLSALFLDVFCFSSLFSAIPIISNHLGISNSNSVWLVDAYQLTFSSFLLASGRLSDLYNPRYIFLAGNLGITGFALGCGFVRDEVALFILRALTGVGASLTIPSALHLTTHMFTEPGPQAKALAAFGAAGSFGNVTGLIIGAVIVDFATWPWVFYVFSILAAILFCIVFILCPSPHRAKTSEMTHLQHIKRLDPVGILMMTAGLTLFIFGVTTGSSIGWGTARCLAPFIISFFLIGGFFVWETQIDPENAAIPPSLWRVKNFAVLMGAATMPYMWWATVQLLLSWVWQNVDGWSPVKTAVHFLPLGLFALPASMLAQFLQQNMRLKRVLAIGQFVALAGTVLLPFADTPQHYWRFAFPAFLLGTSGIMIAFATVNIAVFACTSPDVAGVVGSIFNCFQQFGCAVGSAIATSIQTTINDKHGGPTSWVGRKDAFWFIFALLGFQTLCIMIFMSDDVSPAKAAAQEKGIETPADSVTIKDGVQGSSEKSDGLPKEPLSA